MKRTFSIILLFFLFIGTLAAQRTCASQDYFLEQMEKHPEMRHKLESFKSSLEKRKREAEARNFTVVTIPVVFHIVHNGDPVGTGENLSESLILAQLQQLNDDFSLMNSDVNLIPAFFLPLAANTMIQFCLAERTPDCQATTGILRFNGNQADWTRAQIESTLKPATVWDREQYLNIWTVRFSVAEGGLLGYATFPGGPADLDGSVLLYSSVGSLSNPNPAGGNFGKGRTATHEVGHWLNLFHIWGDATCGDDQVADTPVHETNNSDCPSHPKTNNCNGTTNTEMFMNYMDYVDDNCMHMFSVGQSDRMNDLFVEDIGLRVNLKASSACSATGQCYCSAAALDEAANEKISQVNFGGISKSSVSNTGYQNFTTTTGMVTTGSTYAFSASISNGFSTDQILVWIDYNQNGSFTDAGELVYTSSTGTGPHSTNIAIPNTALTGTTRMRVRLHDTSSGPNSTPCGNSDFGQVEDYSLSIQAALPVEFSRFDVYKAGKNEALLEWELAQQNNIQLFEVEMAAGNGLNFETVATVPVHAAPFYQYTRGNLAPGNYYFRLLYRDRNGQTTYSPVRKIELGKGDAPFSVTPNPVRDVLYIRGTGTASSLLTLRITDQLGRILKEQQVELSDGSCAIDVRDLPDNIYFFQIQRERDTQSGLILVKK